MINYEDDAVAVTRESLAPLAALVEQLKEQRERVADMEKMLKDEQKTLRRIEELEIPAMMDEVGLQEVTMEDGSKLSVEDKLYASISAKNKRNAIKWLIEHGQGALVKEDVVVPFDRGQLEEVAQLQERLQDQGYSCKVQETVNTASVKSVIKELMEQGQDVPLSLFGAHFVRKAILK